MTQTEWTSVVRAGIKRSMLPYRLFSAWLKQGDANYYASVMHERTGKHSQIVILPDAVMTERAIEEEIGRQLKALNVGFAIPCRCGHATHQQYEPEELRQMLASNAVRVFCVACLESREPTAEEKQNLLRLLQDHEQPDRAEAATCRECGAPMELDLRAKPEGTMFTGPDRWVCTNPGCGCVKDAV